jgi:hypothetical protein
MPLILCCPCFLLWKALRQPSKSPMRFLYAFLSNALFLSVFVFLHDSNPYPAGGELARWGGVLVYVTFVLSPLLLLVTLVFNRLLGLAAQVQQAYLPHPWMGWGLVFLTQLLGAWLLFNAFGLVPTTFLLVAVVKAGFDVCFFLSCTRLNPLRQFL